MRRRRQLSNRILASVVAILAATALIGFLLVSLLQRSALQRDYQRRALVVAETFAAMPSVQAAVEHGRPGGLVQRLAEEVRKDTGATYIVVINRSRVRYSHPDPRLIGQRVTERVVALDGHDHVDIDHGNLGISARARVPIWGSGGRPIGEVSAGILESKVSDQLLGELPSLALYFACALGIGVVASLLLARRLKRSTFGLELEEIAALVQEREAMLHGIREGVITLDRSGRVTLINDEGRRLIPLGDTALDRPIGELVPRGRLRSLLTGELRGEDSVVVTDEHILVVNRMPVSRQGRDLGAVITLRDRTELEGLLRELDSVDALTDALRAQQHEFSNRMHTVAGLIELGDEVAASRYALDAAGGSAGLAEALRERIEPPEVAALLLAKTTIAGERGVRLEVSEDSHFVAGGVDAGTLQSIIGNLVDNAIDAAAEGPPPGQVTVRLLTAAGRITIEVTDTGAGVPPELTERIFVDGFSTKPSDRSRHRGIGLALVHRLVRRAGGSIVVDSSGPTVFTVSLPAGMRTPVQVRA